MTVTHGAELSQAAIAAVEDVVRAFAKALRAMQLYLPNNPTRMQAIEHARAAFATVRQHADPLVIRIRESALLWEERVVYDDSERGSEGLPWLMYRDGLRLLTFHDGFDAEGMDGLLAILQRARTASPDDDDLVTLLWVADLPQLSYQHVESHGTLHGHAAAEVEAASAESLAPLAAPAAESTPVGDGPPPEMIRMEDFDETLYFLDPRESAYLQDELRREYTDDPRLGAIAAVFEIVAMKEDVSTRLDAMQLMDQLLLEFLSATDFEMVASVLREASDVRQRGVDAPAVQAALEALPARLSEPNVMAQLLQAVDESSRTPSAALLEGLFAELQPRALVSLFGWLGGAQHSPARTGIERASLRLAAANTGELARLLGSTDRHVVQGALRIATSLGTPAAVSPLAKLLSDSDPSLRAEAVTALREIGTPGAMQSLEQALDDANREVRVAALRAIAARQHTPALARLRAAVRRRETRAADLGEKMALFEAFGALCGEEGVPELDAMLNARGILGAREPTEIRACAARALGLVAAGSAITALQRAAETKDMVVRSAVSRALRGGA